MSLESIHTSLLLFSRIDHGLLFWFCNNFVYSVWNILVQVISLFDFKRYDDGCILCGYCCLSTNTNWHEIIRLS
jgi:hypothetical protein